MVVAVSENSGCVMVITTVVITATNRTAATVSGLFMSYTHLDFSVKLVFKKQPGIQAIG